MFLTIYLAIVLISFVVLHVVIRSGKAARLIDKIPGPTTLPIIGNSLLFSVPLDKLWDGMIQLLDDYNPIVRVWIFNVKLVITRNADDVKVILSCKKNIDKSERLVYNGFKIGAIDMDGLFMSNGEKWRRRRKLMLPAFSSIMMKGYIEIMNEHTERLVNDIKNQNTESVVIDAAIEFNKHAFGIMCEATMGVDPRIYGIEEEEKFIHSYDEIFELIVYRTVRPYMTDWMYWIKELFTGRKQERVVRTFRTFSKKIIQTRREYYEKIGYRKLRNLVDDVEDKDEGTKRLALLDLLFSAQTEGLIDDKGIRDEAEMFMSASYETTGIASALTLMLLAENKDIQDLAREEVTELLDRTGGVLEMADLNRLDYLERCIKESLRLYPSAPMIGRHVSETIKLQNYEIPRGIEVFMHLYQLHRDPNYWPDPEKFDPDRFLPENSDKHHPFAYQPFSAGPRACIGIKFAMLELKTVVARILYNFHIEPIDFLANMKVRTHVTLKPDTPCRVRLIRIKRESNASQVMSDAIILENKVLLT